MKKLLFIIIIFFNSNILSALELKGDFNQGNLILGKANFNSKIFINKKKN